MSQVLAEPGNLNLAGRGQARLALRRVLAEPDGPAEAWSKCSVAEVEPGLYGWGGLGYTHEKCLLAAASGSVVGFPALAEMIRSLGADAYYPAIRRIDCSQGTEADVVAVRELGDLLGVEVRVLIRVLAEAGFGGPGARPRAEAAA